MEGLVSDRGKTLELTGSGCAPDAETGRWVKPIAPGSVRPA